MLVCQKNMFDHYYCLVIMSLEKVGKSFEKLNFQKHERFLGFKNPCSIAMTCVILTSLNYYVHYYACYCL